MHRTARTVSRLRLAAALALMVGLGWLLPAAAGEGVLHQPADPSLQRRRLQQGQGAYQFYLPPDARRRGQTYPGASARVERLVAKLLAGQPVTVVALGGSVTAGSNFGGVSSEPYCTFLEQWLNDRFPCASAAEQHRVINWGRGATTSTFFSFCSDIMLPEAADLAVVEFAVNDAAQPYLPPGRPAFEAPERRSYEKLLRSVLSHPSRPAVFALMTMQWQQAAPGVGSAQSPYYQSAENEMAVIAQYYDIPVLSLRAAAYHLMLTGQPGFEVDINALDAGLMPRPDSVQSDTFFLDGIHPTTHGSRCLADLVAARIQAAADEQQASGGGPSPVPALPPPMLANNYQMATMQCYLPYTSKGEFMQLGSAVAGKGGKDGASGFAWEAQHPNAATVNKQKWAWVASQPGAGLLLTVRTDVMPASNAADPVRLVLFFVKAASRMGQAGVRCLSGCECEQTTVDGNWEEATGAVATPVAFQVSQHPRCRVLVTVRRATSSRGNRVMVAGLAVAHADALRMNMVPYGLYEAGDTTGPPSS